MLVNTARNTGEETSKELSSLPTPYFCDCARVLSGQGYRQHKLSSSLGEAEIIIIIICHMPLLTGDQCIF